MSQSVFVMETPKDCLHCKMRHVIIEENGKIYQQCGCNHDGYKLESFFKTADLKEGWISPKCPLVSKADIRASVIDEFAEKMNQKITEFVLAHQSQLTFVSGVSMGWKFVDEIAEQLKEE